MINLFDEEHGEFSESSSLAQALRSTPIGLPNSPR
jgi:hypothetical protein